MMNTLVAVTPGDIAPAQTTLIDFLTGRLDALTREYNEAAGELDYARQHKWRTTALQNIVNKLAKKQTFYEKLKAAVQAGFVIMPALPMDVIAIRTRAVTPRGEPQNYSSRFEQHAQALPQGDGEYRDPFPFTEEDTNTVSDGKGGTKEQKVYYPTAFDDEFAMPVALCKPTVLERTTEAMALKLFDEIGVVRDQPKGDPIVVGNIIDPTRRRRFAFFIAWALPLDDL